AKALSICWIMLAVSCSCIVVLLENSGGSAEGRGENLLAQAVAGERGQRADVAHDLLYRVIIDVAVTAVDLHGVDRGLHRGFAGDRRRLPAEGAGGFAVI